MAGVGAACINALALRLPKYSFAAAPARLSAAFVYPILLSGCEFPSGRPVRSCGIGKQKPPSQRYDPDCRQSVCGRKGGDAQQEAQLVFVQVSYPSHDPLVQQRDSYLGSTARGKAISCLRCVLLTPCRIQQVWSQVSDQPCLVRGGQQLKVVQREPHNGVLRSCQNSPCLMRRAMPLALPVIRWGYVPGTVHA